MQRRVPDAQRRAQVVHVTAMGPLQPLAVDDRYGWVLLVVHGRRGVIGQIFIPVRPGSVLTAAAQRAAIVRELGDRIWRDRVQDFFQVLIANGTARADVPSVAVVVCTRDRPDQLRSCLDALLQLRTRPAEIVVVDNAPSDDRTADVCRGLPVRYVREDTAGQARARNRGIVETTADLVAFTDDDCTPGPGWLDGLAASFADPLVMAVTGYVVPAELEHPAQFLFETHYGFGRATERSIIDPFLTGAVRGAAKAGAGANMIFRREVFREVGLFPEEFGPGTPARSGDDKYYFYKLLAAGFRIVQEPSREVGHRHRADDDALRRIMSDYGTSEFAYALRCLVRHRELPALLIVAWWIQHFFHDLLALVRRTPTHAPARMVLAEIGGAVAGPWRLLRSTRSRRGIPPIELPAAASDDHDDVVHDVRELPALSVVVPTYNRRDELRFVLDGLARQDYPHSRFEVVVLVDGSSDGTAEMARSLELPYSLRVVEQPNRGLAAARNNGVRHARHDVVVSLDDDIRPVTSFVRAHATAQRDGGADHVALGYCPPAVGDGFWGKILRAWWEDHYRVKAQPDHPWTFTDFADGNASMRRELFLAAGGYDEAFDGKNRQDWDLGHRLLKHGARFGFRAEAKAWHHYRPVFRGAVSNQRECGRLDVLLASKHPDLIGRLPIVNVSRLIEWRPSVLGPLHTWRSRLEVETGLVVPLLDAYESLGLRRRWQNLANDVLLRAYLLGVLDAFASSEELREFLRPIALREDVTSVPFALDRARGGVPPGVGRVELELRTAEASVASVSALEGAAHWDWDTIGHRILDEAGEALRLELAVGALDRLANSAGEA